MQGRNLQVSFESARLAGLSRKERIRSFPIIALSDCLRIHAGARHVGLRLLCRRHCLLRTWRHLRVRASARVPLALLLRLLTVEGWHEGRALAVLVLHVRREPLVRTRVRHHVRAWSRRTSVAVGSCALLRHVREVRLGVRRHRRIALVLGRHETAGRRVLGHHRCTSAHLRHVRTEAWAWGEPGAHLVH